MRKTKLLLLHAGLLINLACTAESSIAPSEVKNVDREIKAIVIAVSPNPSEKQSLTSNEKDRVSEKKVTSEDELVPVIQIPVATPFPRSTRSLETVEKAYISGTVYKDNGEILKNVLVTIKSKEHDFFDETIAEEGSYSFKNVPEGDFVLSAKLDGYTAREIEGFASTGNTTCYGSNTYHFGRYFDCNMYSKFSKSLALSDSPEIIRHEPKSNRFYDSPITEFIFEFSEPVNKESVEKNFEVKAFTREILSVDKRSYRDIISYSTVDGLYSIVSDLSGTKIWDRNAFESEWKNSDKEVTFRFKDGYALPADAIRENTPDYQVSFNYEDGKIADKESNERQVRHFKSYKDHEIWYKFSIPADQIKPNISKVEKTFLEDNRSESDGMRVVFSKPMRYKTLNFDISGGMNGDALQAPAAALDRYGNNVVSAENAAKNYLLTIIRNEKIIHDRIMWSNLGGSVTFDEKDVTNRSVKLSLPKKLSNDKNWFEIGDKIIVTVSKSVLDPAGNPLNVDSETLIW